MTYRVVGTSARASEPIERVVETAVEADAEVIAVRRLCGRSGQVQVWRKGRLVTVASLATAVRKELAGT